jgi:hypothetical protein
MGATLINLAQWLIKVNAWAKKIPAGLGFKISS